MDMVHSNSIQRLYLSDDPHDWVWVRFYFAQDDAKSYPGWTAYGHPLLEDRRTGENRLPAIRLEPYKYFPSKVSPFPGQDFRGKPEWFEFGLPADERVGGEEGTHCGVMRWDGGVEVTLDAEDSSWQVPNPLMPVGGDVDDGVAQIQPQSPALVGSGTMLSGVGFNVRIRYPAGQVGDLLLLLDRTQTPVGNPITVPPLWELLYVGDPATDNKRLIVAFQVRTSADAQDILHLAQSTFHEGWIACLRDAGLPWEITGAVGDSDTAVYPPVEGPVGDESTVFRVLGALFGFPDQPVPPAGHFLWPLQGDTDHEPTVFARYDSTGSESGGTATLTFSEPWETLSLAVPHSNYVKGRGGDLDGGVAAIAEGYQWTAEGGDVDGGVSIQAGGYHQAAAGGDVDGGTAEQGDSMYVGEIRMFGQDGPPSGWYPCDGSSLSRTTYAALFAVIGTTYGDPGGGTHFRVPDLRGRCPISADQGSGLTNRNVGDSGGEETHTLSSSEMPAHTHTMSPEAAIDGVGAGGLTARDVGTLATRNIAVPGWATASAGGGGAHQNMQPWLCVRFAIKT